MPDSIFQDIVIIIIKVDENRVKIYIIMQCGQNFDAQNLITAEFIMVHHIIKTKMCDPVDKDDSTF